MYLCLICFLDSFIYFLMNFNLIICHKWFI